jgi:hypothetical protein
MRLDAGGGTDRPRAAAATDPTGVVLHELHTWESNAVPETLVTCIAPGRLRLSHASGDAIVDVAADRLVILDRRTFTSRMMSFAAWEGQIVAATAGAADDSRTDSTAAAPAPASPSSVPRFELIGDGGQIAGFACTRHHLFLRHQIFPGEFERVEAEIWVTDQIPLLPQALDTYRRVVSSLDRVDLGVAAERPPGIALRTCLRHFPETPGAPEEVETSEVLTVEQRAIAPGEFAIPASYTPTDSVPGPQAP